MKKTILMLIIAAMTVTGCANGQIPEAVEETEVPAEAEAPEEAEAPAEAEAPEETEAPAETPSEAEAPEETDVPEEAAEAAPGEALKTAVNSFDRKLYENSGEKGNLFYSPFSIVSALALSELAAKDDTAEEILNVLSIKDEQGFREELKQFSEKEKTDSAYFESANALFIDKSLTLSPGYEQDFKEPAEEYFKSGTESLDFAGDLKGAKERISSFVNEKTEGMIADYESTVTKDTVADILNAVYFYGEWMKKFEAEDTFKETFYGDTSEKEVEMMHMFRERFRIVPDLKGIKAVALPYAGDRYEMDILLLSASDKKDLSLLFKEATLEEVLDALDSAEEVSLSRLFIPRFQMDLTYDGLKETLQKMGMKKAFTDQADFSLLADDLYVTDISHRAKVEVDEEGSRAAAVTEMMMSLTSVGPTEEKEEEFIADKPFIFYIRDRESGVILFTGRVNDIK